MSSVRRYWASAGEAQPEVAGGEIRFGGGLARGDRHLLVVGRGVGRAVLLERRRGRQLQRRGRLFAVEADFATEVFHRRVVAGGQRASAGRQQVGRRMPALPDAPADRQSQNDERERQPFLHWPALGVTTLPGS